MNEIEILKILYNNLSFQLMKLDKGKSDSLLIDFMKIKSNGRINILNTSAEKLDNIDESIKQKLISEKYIKENELGRYYISAFGIFEVEKEEKDLVCEIMEFFDKEYFTNKSVNKTLSNRERIILLLLITIRAFNSETALDLKQNDLVKDTCANIMDAFYQKLANMDVLKDSKGSFYGKTGNEHKVSNVIRHTDELPRKTRMIYINGLNKEQKYYLDLSDDNNIGVLKLKFIVNKIFEGVQLDYSNIKEISDLISELAYKNGPNIYSDISNSFVQTKYDQTIKNAIEDAMMGI